MIGLKFYNKIYSLKNCLLCLIHFRNFSYRRKIYYPFRIQGAENIVIGDSSEINKYSWLLALPLTGKSDAKIIIGNGCRIQMFSHIVSTHRVIIGNKVNIANSVYISDNTHGFEDITLAPMDQPIIQKKDVSIGDETWIGERVAIIGASVGKHCVIGTNTVVTRDIPDYCVAVGTPAKIIKRYNFETQQWEKTDKDGNFLNK